MPDIGKDYLKAALVGFNATAQTRQELMRSGPLKRADKTNGNSELAKNGEQLADIEKASRQFEALLLHQMIKTMWHTVPSKGLLTGSREEELYRDMLNEALATSISEGQGIGIRDIIVRDMKRIEEID